MKKRKEWLLQGGKRCCPLYLYNNEAKAKRGIESAENAKKCSDTIKIRAPVKRQASINKRFEIFHRRILSLLFYHNSKKVTSV